MSKPVIKNLRINRVHVDFSRNITNRFQLDIECKTQIKAPKDIYDHTALLMIQLFVSTPASDFLSIVMDADIIFEFDEIPKDYEEISKKECTPVAQERLFRILDDILVNMGYHPLNLKPRSE